MEWTSVKECYDSHIEDMPDSFFSFEEYRDFWTNHNIGDVYEMKNRNGSVVTCTIVYYPLPYYKDLRALIEVDMVDGVDLRDVPIKFLNKKTNAVQ